MYDACIPIYCQVTPLPLNLAIIRACIHTYIHTQLAPATTKPLYAEVMQATARKARPQTKMVVQRQTPAMGIPLQPVAEELHRTAEKGGYGAVQPAPPYLDRDLVGTGMI